MKCFTGSRRSVAMEQRVFVLLLSRCYYFTILYFAPHSLDKSLSFLYHSIGTRC